MITKNKVSLVKIGADINLPNGYNGDNKSRKDHGMLHLSNSKVNNLILCGLFLISSGFLAIVSLNVPPQASQDAAYYHIMADQLEKGAGFTEPFIWHFLNDYSDLEHPMDYWMPLGIVFYYLSRFFAGISGEVWLNIFIWAVLCVMVFKDTLKITGEKHIALMAFAVMLFSGRFLFYVLTTDNIAFYALFGYVFFKLLRQEHPRPSFIAIISGMSALMRIEGILIALAGGVFSYYKTRKGKVLLEYLLVFALVLSPWIIRNLIVLNHPWPSNSKALYLLEYNEMFRRDIDLASGHYWSSGVSVLLKQKVRGLQISVLNFFAAPGMLLLYPFWIAGLKLTWKSDGRYFLILLGFFVIFCGLIIPVQAEKGSAFHISAFFYSYYCFLAGLGMGVFRDYYRMSRKFSYAVVIPICFWAILVSCFSFEMLSNEYLQENKPYEQLLSGLAMEGRKTVSAAPIKLFLETSSQGVVASSVDAQEPLKLADDFGCDTILIDNRAVDFQPLPESPFWREVASNDQLKIYFRKAGLP